MFFVLLQGENNEHEITSERNNMRRTFTDLLHLIVHYNNAFKVTYYLQSYALN